MQKQIGILIVSLVMATFSASTSEAVKPSVSGTVETAKKAKNWIGERKSVQFAARTGRAVKGWIGERKG